LPRTFSLCPCNRYILAARRAKVPAVPRVDRQDLLSYLTGQSDDSVHIDKGRFGAPVAERVQDRAAEKRPVDEAGGIDASKRARITTGAPGATETLLGHLKDTQAASIAPSQITQLSDTLTPEVIAELRAKKRKKEASSISTAEVAVGEAHAGEDTSDLTAEITAREIMCVPTVECVLPYLRLFVYLSICVSAGYLLSLCCLFVCLFGCSRCSFVCLTVIG